LIIHTDMVGWFHTSNAYLSGSGTLLGSGALGD
jgi:hypothetical protein